MRYSYSIIIMMILVPGILFGGSNLHPKLISNNKNTKPNLIFFKNNIKYYSSDRGLTWNSIKSFKHQKLLLISKNTMFMSNDRGVNWNQINIFQENKFRIASNPVDIYLKIYLKTEIVSLSNLSVTIFDIYGVNQKQMENIQKQESFEIDVSGLPSGLYFVRIGTQFSKFVKL